MKLSLIAEGYKSALSQLKPVLKSLSPAKQRHSKEVARSLSKAGVGSAGIRAGLSHDYLEAGGDLEKLSKRLGKYNNSSRTLQVVQALSNDEKTDRDGGDNPPLEHLQAVLSTSQMDEKTKNLIILVKLSDRLDNLKKRVRRNELSKNYVRKSTDLVKFCLSQYTGNPEKAETLLRQIGKVIALLPR